MRHVAFGCLLVLGVGCTKTRPPAITALHYDAHLRGLEPCVVDVDVEVEGDAPAFAGAEPAGLVSVEVEDARGKRSPELRDGAALVDCRAACRISYRYDLSRAAKVGGGSMRGARERSGEVLTAATTWMLRPKTKVVGAAVDLSVEVPEGLHFTSGLRRSADGRSYVLRSEELPTLGFTAFGKTAPRTVKATGGDVEVLVLPGKRAATDEVVGRWVEQSARAQDEVFGRFPMDRAAVFVVPWPDSNGVGHGVTLPSGGASIALLLGESADERALLEEDWVLTHEMFHLGVPSFSRDEAWLDEGLATYYEPLARTRAGLRSPASFWQEMTRDMPRGIQSDEPLPSARDFGRIYWGGALLAMRADVEIRWRTERKRSLDDGLRRALELGGDATHELDAVAVRGRDRRGGGGAGARRARGSREGAAAEPRLWGENERSDVAARSMRLGRRVARGVVRRARRARGRGDAHVRRGRAARRDSKGSRRPSGFALRRCGRVRARSDRLRGRKQWARRPDHENRDNGSAAFDRGSPAITRRARRAACECRGSSRGRRDRPRRAIR